MVQSQSVFQMIKGQNFIYEEMHVFVFALSKFDNVRYDYFEAVRKAVAAKRIEITQKVPRGPKRQEALKAFESTKMQFESEMLQKFMQNGTDQRMNDLPAVVNDAAHAIDYCLNQLGCLPNNIHLFALPADREIIMAKVGAGDDEGMDEEEIRRKPDDHVQMRWRTVTKAKYDFMFRNCLTEEQRNLVERSKEICHHEPTVEEWEKQFKLLVERANVKKPDGELKNTLVMQFFAGHGMTYNGEQVLLGNDYDEKNEWYKFLKVEQSVRTAAGFNTNIYFFTVFACCREKYMMKNNENRDEMQHRGISMKTIEENKAGSTQALFDQKEKAAAEGSPAEPQEEHELPASRGGNITGIASTKTVNFCFVFGCQPGAGVLAKTQLIRDLTQHLTEHSK